MRLLRLHLNGAATSRLDLHPLVTVVTGLDPETRAHLCDTLGALPRGGDTSLDGLLEAHGVILDLSPENLSLFDLDSSVESVVRARDIPGILVEEVAPQQPAGIDLDANEDVDGLVAEVEAWEQLVAERAKAVARAESQLEEARVMLDPHAVTANERAVELFDRARAMAADRLAAETANAGSLEEKIIRATAERDKLQRELAELEEIDVTGVRSALDGLRAVEHPEAEPVPEAIEIADEWVQLQQDLDTLQRRLASEGRSPAQLQQRLEAARAELAEVEALLDAPGVSEEDAAAIEATHDELVELADRMSSRIGGRGAQRRHEEAAGELDALLEKVGFPTYTAYLMDKASPRVDMALRERHERAVADLEAAEQAWSALEVETEIDPQQIELRNRIIDLQTRARELVPEAEVEEIESQLRGLRRIPQTAEDELAGAVQALREDLESVGVDISEMDLRVDELAAVAEAWISEMAELTAAAQDLRARLEDITAEIEADEVTLSEITGQEMSEEELLACQPEVIAALDELEAAQLRLDRHREVVDRVDVLHAAHEAAIAEQNTAERELATARGRLSTATDDDQEVAEAEPVWGADVDDDHIEWYLLARLAAVRKISLAGSVPLVIDDALKGLPARSVRLLLERLGSLSEAVQVIYLSDDEEVVRWARSLEPDRGSVIDLSSMAA